MDGRVLPGCEEEFRAALDELTGSEVSWEYAHREIPLEAPLGAPVMASMTRALLAEDPGSTIVPYCMSGGTDAKQFARLGMTCYGFACGPIGLVSHTVPHHPVALFVHSVSGVRVIIMFQRCRLSGIQPGLTRRLRHLADRADTSSAGPVAARERLPGGGARRVCQLSAP